MKSKYVIKAVLFLFVLSSAGYLVFDEIRSGRDLPAAEVNMPTVAEPDLPAVAESNEPLAQELSSKVIVYYFYGTARCATCMKFESFSKEALGAAFSESLEEGLLEWRAVNVDEPDNGHFVSDYQLYSKSIVVVKMRDGKQVEWKNLKRIWKLVRDKQVFVKYIQDEVGVYLGAN